MPSTVERQSQFSSYNFDTDERWLEYKRNLTIPPGRDEDAVLLRYSQKFYKRYVDSEYEVPSSSSSGGTGPQAGPSPSGPQPSQSQVPPRGSNGGGVGASGANGSAAGRGMSMFDADTTTLLVNAWVLVMAPLSLLPILPAALTFRMYRYALLGSAVGQLQKLGSRFGPTMPRTFSLQIWSAWVKPMLGSPELIDLMYCFIFFTSRFPVAIAVVPVGIVAALKVSEQLRRNFSQAALYKKYLQRWCIMAEQNTAYLHSLAANTEISIGFVLIAQLLFPSRNLMQAFIYWQFLKMKFHSPASAYLHRGVWSAIGYRVEPLLQQYLPMSLSLIAYVKRWFLTVR